VLKEAGLKRLTVSLDSLDDKIFKKLNGREFSIDQVLEGIEAAENIGFRPIKINVVVQRGINDCSILSLLEYFKKRGHIVRFIEYMDAGNINNWKPEDVFTADEILSKINEKYPLEPVDPLGREEVAARYKLKDGSGEIGVISSITRPFCSECSRIRLSLDGKLYTCLFAEKGTDLKTMIRNGADDTDIRDLILKVWNEREDRYSELRAELLKNNISKKKIEMFHIGG
jgi:cyclic pyranopterin phosphate synthase